MLIRISFEYSRKYIEEPLVRIASAMKAVEEGELDTHVSSMSQILEFNQLENSFNHMIERIQQLKIEKYETELTAQKASMQYLQVQIKPHFYANMLNIIYSLAETKDYATIQKISRAIVEFSRYMFRDATQMVELKRELEYVNCYMDIQEIRYQKQITLETEIMENLDEALVPPFVIQGFVENSVKYAFSTRKNCLIKVSISLDDERENIHICIRDNGIGYPETMLGEGWHDISYQMEEHIGFENLYKRMELIYGQNAKIWLANEEGAVTYINIPYIAIDNMAEDDL
jgi:sensor histidine kinase YesM